MGITYTDGLRIAADPAVRAVLAAVPRVPVHQAWNKGMTGLPARRRYASDEERRAAFRKSNMASDKRRRAKQKAAKRAAWLERTAQLRIA